MALHNDNGVPIQAVVPNPAFSQVNAAMTGTKVFKKGAGGDVDITRWSFINVSPVAESSYYFNDDSTKLMALPAGVPTPIPVQDVNVVKVTILFGSAVASSCVQGM